MTKLLFGKDAGLVQPGCTIELLPVIAARQFGEFQSFAPSHLLQLSLRLWRKVLMYGHQVVGFASGIREAPLQKVVEGFQILQTPVLSGAYLAEIASEFDEACVL